MNDSYSLFDSQLFRLRTKFIAGNKNSVEDAAKVGSIVSLFATGAGALDPPIPSGMAPSFPLPMPRLPVSVYIDGHPAEVLWISAAPGLVGMIQVLARIPVKTKPGAAVPVHLVVGAASSQSRVTLAVE